MAGKKHELKPISPADLAEEIVPDEVINVLKPIKKSGIVFLGIILLLVALIFGLYVVPFYINAMNTGENIGNTAGSWAGIAAGSFEGITEGLAKGAEDGKEEGLSAKDTQSTIANEMKQIGKLDILEADDQFVDTFEYGEDYKALFLYKATAIFTVDLANAEITLNEDSLTILLPEPEVEFNIDETESEKLTEWQKHFWSGQSKDGYTAYMNSMQKIKESAASEMSNYEALMDQAKESAIKQVTTLAESVVVEDKEIIVDFEGEVE